MQPNKKYTSKVLEICDNGDAILELPPEMCEDLQWKEGDTLNIKLDGDKIILEKVKDAT
jgi:antitoxin component of MazEF toxin-antitoxin module